MMPRVLEPEVMDTPEEAKDYDSMDHRDVNAKFVSDFLAHWGLEAGNVLDVGTGTAQIPVEFALRHPGPHITAIDLSQHMLELAASNAKAAGVADRITLQKVDAKELPYAAESFEAVISNSIIHHIPNPGESLAEMTRVCRTGGVLFVRDLCRPEDDAEVKRLVEMYAQGANTHQRQLFDQSLRAALNLQEIRAMVIELGFEESDVEKTSDRHWTWMARKGESDG